jgi:hypothetical protein
LLSNATCTATHRLAINVARGLAAAAAGGGGQTVGGGGSRQSWAEGDDRDIFAAPREELEDVAAAAWSRGHHVVETAASHLLGVLREWLLESATSTAGSDHGHIFGASDGGQVGQHQHQHQRVSRQSSAGSGYAYDGGDMDHNLSGGGGGSGSGSPHGSQTPPRVPVGLAAVPGGHHHSHHHSPTRQSHHHSHHPHHPHSHHSQPGIEDFEVLKLISSGAYGKVFLCRKHTTVGQWHVDSP